MYLDEAYDDELTTLEWQRYEEDLRNAEAVNSFARDAEYAARQIEADAMGVPR